MAISFYRAVSLAELADFRQLRRLRIARNSCEGKHLACSPEDARRWGEVIYGQHAFGILEVTVSEAAAAQFARWDKLDGIGPACFATMEQLAEAEVAET